MRRWCLLVAAAAAVVAPAPTSAQSGAGDLARARDHYQAGRYAPARAILAPASADAAASVDFPILYTRLLAERGEYEDGLSMLERAAERRGGNAPVALARSRGELLLALGRLDEARAAFELALEGGAPDAPLARLHLGWMDFRAGQVEEARATFDSFIDLYNGGGARSGEALLAVAGAVTWLGRTTPALFQDALRAYDEAAEALPGDARPLVAIGDLFLSRYQSPDAYDEYRRVLERNPRQPDALLGRARAQDFDGNPEALSTVETALEVNPRMVGAHVLAARIHLRAEDLDAAEAAAREALETNPASLEALSILAATHHLAGDTAGFREATARVDALNPAWAGLHTELARVSADTRKYADAVGFAREAVRRDPEAWEALGLLATNQLRTGEMEEGRANMEAAFAGNPFNPWYKNSLDLLDDLATYRVVETEHFQIVLNESEADLLEPYVVPLAEEAYAALAERYGTEPPLPIRLELFPRHADFSVRTLGLVGLGALGVSFGSTLVMDSPSARNAGEFNWASTLWHELAHAFHLGMSDHNVPRWFSEGLAMREQRVATPRWGFRATPSYLQAWSGGIMPELSRMNEGFVRPRFPQQVSFSYLQASLAFDWIEARWGVQALRGFLRGYGEGRSTAELAESILGLDSKGLDEGFREYMSTRFQGELAATETSASPLDRLRNRDEGEETAPGGIPAGHGMGGLDVQVLRERVRLQPGSFPARLALGQVLLADGALDEAEEHLREALRLFPAYPGLDGPLAGLSRIHRERGETLAAANALRRLASLNENAFQVSVTEAGLRRELNDEAGELAALERAVEIYPFVADHHERLAQLYETAGDTRGAVVERRAVLALDPPNLADAHYQLARAHLANGDRREARSQILRALELAPTFGDALDLLLEIRGGGQ